MTISNALRTTRPITWHEPPKELAVHECRTFEISCPCPDDECTGELRFANASMPQTYGSQSHYHKCDGCGGTWLIKGRFFPEQKRVRLELIDEFLRDYGGTAPSS